MRLFCFGCGYTIGYLAEILKQETGREKSWQIAGTARSNAKAQSLRESGIDSYVYDGTAETARQKESIIKALQNADAVLNSIPPINGEDTVLRDFSDTLRELKKETWLGYLSTTGVYGDRGGDSVDETSPVRPTGERGRARVIAEDGWLALNRGVYIFRLAGIYGMGRNSLMSVKSGKARRIYKKNHVFSRIHVEDLARALRSALDLPPHSREVFNICDDEAAPPQDVVAYACELLGAPPPPLIALEDADLSAMARSFYADSKRVGNEKMKRELRISLQYPNYRVGLKHLLAEEKL